MTSIGPPASPGRSERTECEAHRGADINKTKDHLRNKTVTANVGGRTDRTEPARRSHREQGKRNVRDEIRPGP